MLSANSRLLGALFCAAIVLAACADSVEIQAATSVPTASGATISSPTTTGPAAAKSTTTGLAVSTNADPSDDHVHTDEHGADDEHVGHDRENHDDADEPDDGAVAGDAAPDDADTTITIEVVDGQVAGGSKRFSAEVGSVVLIEVHLDGADEIHLHGYDFTVVGEAGERVRLAFVAAIPGVWAAELEGAGVKLLELEVS